MNSYLVKWKDGVLTPVPSSRKACEEDFAGRQFYRIQIREERSQLSHDHYFASLTEAWKNLPEDLAENIPTVEHLRKYALIKAGYRDQRSIAAASPEQAQGLVALVKGYDDFAIVTVNDSVVTVHTAKSQSMRAMGKRDFQDSKSKVLDIVAGLVGVTKDELAANAGRAA